MSDLKLKIQQLKSSFTVDGVPLIKSDRFTQEEYDLMKKTHKSSYGWNHLGKNKKVWSDQEIGEQITTLLEEKIIANTELKKILNQYYKTIKYESYKKEFADLKQLIYSTIGWDKLTPLDPEFWSAFGSAPYSMKYSREHLQEFIDKYGACGMDEIFGKKFEESSSRYDINNMLCGFKDEWERNAEHKKKKIETFSSPFKSLDDIEENVTVKKIPEQAKLFYLDSTKPINERIKVFNAHGESEIYIHQPDNRDLASIFDIWMEETDRQRHSTAKVMDILEWWIGRLKDKRQELDWRNQYHPKFISTKRNYVPNKKAIDRLFCYYAEILLLEGISKFKIDW